MVKNVGKNRRKKIKNKKFLEKGGVGSVLANRGMPPSVLWELTAYKVLIFSVLYRFSRFCNSEINDRFAHKNGRFSISYKIFPILLHLYLLLCRRETYHFISVKHSIS